MRICSVEGCEGKHKGRGLCAKHIQEENRRLKGIPEKPVRGLCSVAWCENLSHSHGLCVNHRSIEKRNGSPTEYRRARNGQGTVGGGRRMVSREGRQRYEHIVFCEQWYGSLPENSVVHHLDGEQQNNSQSNLLVCSGQGQHMRVHHWQELVFYGATGPRKLDPALCVPVVGHTLATMEHRGMLFDKDGNYVEVPALRFYKEDK